MVLEKTLESPLDSKEIKPVNPKGNQLWIFIGRTDAETEVPVLCTPDAKSWFIRKDLDAEKDWRQEEKGMTEDEMVRWHINSMDMSLSKLWEMMKDGKVWRAAVHGVTKSQTLLSNWTTTIVQKHYEVSRKYILNFYLFLASNMQSDTLLWWQAGQSATVPGQLGNALIMVIHL